MSERMLQIENLVKSYRGDEKTIDNVNIHVEKGDIYGFIGPNGAGKTTTIKCVVGILNFDSGEIYIDRKSVKEDPIGCKMDMAYIPEETNLYENLTGIQYLNFVSDIYKVNARTRADLIDKYATMFEFKTNLSDLISSYSHGMRQKLAIISSLIHEPKLLILDEPFVGLDPKATFMLKTVMKEICKKNGAIFFSTHILEMAQKLCNKISIIKHGKIVIDGEMEKMIKDKSLEELFMEL